MSKLRIVNLVLLLGVIYIFSWQMRMEKIELKAQDDSEIYEYIKKIYPRLKEFDIIKTSKGVKAIIGKY